MSAVTDQDLARFLIETAEYYQRNISAAQMQPYLDSLRRFPLKRLKESRQFHYEDPERGQYFPKIADFIRCIRKTQQSAVVQEITEARTAIETPYQRFSSYARFLFMRKQTGLKVKPMFKPADIEPILVKALDEELKQLTDWEQVAVLVDELWSKRDAVRGVQV